MSDVVATRVVVFVFVAIVIVAVIAWMSVGYWISSRTAERKDRERNALLRHLAGQPGESVRLVLEKLREDDAAQAEAWRNYHDTKAREAAALGLPTGVVVIAASVGLSIFLHAVADDGHKAVWTLGLVPLFVGIVIAAFAMFGKRKSSRVARDDSDSTAR